jgi:putative hydrolase of the HAD superfamily
MPERPVILSDADNTLWDTDAIFAEAQLLMLELMESEVGLTAPDSDRLSWHRSYDQAIAKVDHRRLRYPPALLVQALALGLSGMAPREAAAASIGGRTQAVPADKVDAIVSKYVARLEASPNLLPGVLEGLTAAREAGVEVWVLTEGAADRQRARISNRGIADLIEGVAEATKTVEQFDRQRRRFAPKPLYVVGDQPDRDIIPARAAGCRAVLVPSRFRPAWHDEAAWTTADHVANGFEEAVAWILESALIAPIIGAATT